MVTIEDLRKPWLIVSNNARNSQLPSALAVRITTTRKPNLDAIVELAPSDPLVGRVLCDEIGTIWHDELEETRGTLTPATMMRVDAGLRAALALRGPT